MLEIDDSVGCPGGQKISSCGIGYALAVKLCERVGSVDACTTTAPDAITAFAVPSPGCFSQQVVFSGLVAQRVTSPSESLGLLRTGQFYLTSPFDRRRLHVTTVALRNAVTRITQFEDSAVRRRTSARAVCAGVESLPVRRLPACFLSTPARPKLQ